VLNSKFEDGAFTGWIPCNPSSNGMVGVKDGDIGVIDSIGIFR
jgi:hypothetical protein